MKYLVVGLGNIGNEYSNTRHNIGFKVLDAFAKASNIVFDECARYGAIAKCRVKSGNAVRYWLNKENIPIENLLIIVDDLSLTFGAIRLKGNGSSGGHNGLKSIEQLIGAKYSRLRFGIGNDFPKGMQVEFVLGEWSDEEQVALQPRIEMACEVIKSFCLAGLQNTMNLYNNK